MTGDTTLEVTESRLGALPRYLIAGGLSFVVDYGVLALCFQVLDLPLWFSTTAGFWTSFVVNFMLHRSWTFAADDGRTSSQLTRYSILVGVNYLLTLALISGLHHLAVPLMIAKVLTVGALTVSNYVLYKVWVFAG